MGNLNIAQMCKFTPDDLDKNNHNNEDVQNPEDLPQPKYARPVVQVMKIRPKVSSVYSRITRRSINPLTQSQANKYPKYYVFSLHGYYEGPWKNGLPEGFGRLYLDSGALYEGQFKQGKADSEDAIFVLPFGSYYRGNIKEGMVSGYGMFANDEVSYQGKWLNNLPHGYGRQKFTSGPGYEGEFRNGKKHGEGLFYWDARTYYRGKFEDGNIVGQGTFVSPEVQYIGEFRDGTKHGNGKQIYNNGDYYIGQFMTDMRSGQGTLQLKDGRKISGEFVRGSLKNIGSGMGSQATCKTEMNYCQWFSGEKEVLNTQ